MNDEEYLQWMNMYKYFMNQAEFVVDEDMIRPMYKQSVLLIMNSMRKAAKSKDFIEMKKLLNIFKSVDPLLMDENKLLPIAQKYLADNKLESITIDIGNVNKLSSLSFDVNVCYTQNLMISYFFNGCYVFC